VLSAEKGLWVQTGTGNGATTIAYSTTGQPPWTAVVNSSTIFTVRGYAVAYSSSQNKFVAGGTGGHQFADSADGTSWSAQTSFPFSSSAFAIAFSEISSCGWPGETMVVAEGRPLQGLKTGRAGSIMPALQFLASHALGLLTRRPCSFGLESDQEQTQSRRPATTVCPGMGREQACSQTWVKQWLGVRRRVFS
jgi:hypothetical protein